MDNFDYLNYIKNNPLLNEIKVNNPNPMYYIVDEDEPSEIWFKGNKTKCKEEWWRTLEEDGFGGVVLYSQEEYDEVLKDNLDEIKINNPTDIFQVTEEGRKGIEEIYQLEQLLDKWGGDQSDRIRDLLQGLEKYANMFWLYVVSSKYGESIIQDNGINKIKDFKDKYITKLGGEEEEANWMLEFWKKQGWIK